jgi:hypothetical protein
MRVVHALVQRSYVDVSYSEYITLTLPHHTMQASITSTSAGAGEIQQHVHT